MDGTRCPSADADSSEGGESPETSSFRLSAHASAEQFNDFLCPGSPSNKVTRSFVCSLTIIPEVILAST